MRMTHLGPHYILPPHFPQQWGKRWMSIPQCWVWDWEVSKPCALWYKKVVHRYPGYIGGKLGFSSGFGVILDLWIHKAVLELFLFPPPFPLEDVSVDLCL